MTHCCIPYKCHTFPANLAINWFVYNMHLVRCSHLVNPKEHTFVDTFAKQHNIYLACKYP